MDAAARSAIRAAAPCARLPEKYSSAFLDLQVLFYFKNKPSGPEPKPKIVPLQQEELSSAGGAGGARDAHDCG
jgi:hypothetical protein